MTRPFGSHVALSSTLLDTAVTARTIGYGAAQIFLGPPQTYNLRKIPPVDVSNTALYLRTTGFKLYVHAPYVLHAFAKPENLKKNNSVLAKHVQMAADLGCSGYIVHMGGTKWYPYIRGVVEPGLRLSLELCSMIGSETLAKCPLLFENCASGNHLSGDLGEIMYLLKEIRSRGFNVGLCLDTLHAYSWGFDRLPWHGKIEETDVDFEGMLSLIHLNSATDKVKFGSHYDRHEGIKAGTISPDFFEILLSMHPECPVIVERDEYAKIMDDWEYVKLFDRRRELGLTMPSAMSDTEQKIG